MTPSPFTVRNQNTGSAPRALSTELPVNLHFQTVYAFRITIIIQKSVSQNVSRSPESVPGSLTVSPAGGREALWTNTI